jgi:hypothetical protein
VPMLIIVPIGVATLIWLLISMKRV